MSFLNFKYSFPLISLAIVLIVIIVGSIPYSNRLEGVYKGGIYYSEEGEFVPVVEVKLSDFHVIIDNNYKLADLLGRNEIRIGARVSSSGNLHLRVDAKSKKVAENTYALIVKDVNFFLNNHTNKLFMNLCKADESEQLSIFNSKNKKRVLINDGFLQFNLIRDCKGKPLYIITENSPTYEDQSNYIDFERAIFYFCIFFYSLIFLASLYYLHFKGRNRS